MPREGQAGAPLLRPPGNRAANLSKAAPPVLVTAHPTGTPPLFPPSGKHSAVVSRRMKFYPPVGSPLPPRIYSLWVELCLGAAPRADFHLPRAAGETSSPARLRAGASYPSSATKLRPAVTPRRALLVTDRLGAKIRPRGGDWPRERLTPWSVFLKGFPFYPGGGGFCVDQWDPSARPVSRARMGKVSGIKRFKLLSSCRRVYAFKVTEKEKEEENKNRGEERRQVQRKRERGGGEKGGRGEECVRVVETEREGGRTPG